MQSFSRSGHRIAFEVHGTGRPVVMLHGITVSFAGNFGPAGWIPRLTAAGCQVIGMDFRGHGRSDKPRDVLAYGTDPLAGDVVALLDHLGIERASLFGYSMGTMVALRLLHQLPHRTGPSVLMATGDGLIGVPPFTSTDVFPRLAEALARPEFPADLPDHVAAYWTFAVKVGGIGWRHMLRRRRTIRPQPVKNCKRLPLLCWWSAENAILCSGGERRWPRRSPSESIWRLLGRATSISAGTSALRQKRPDSFHEPSVRPEPGDSHCGSDDWTSPSPAAANVVDAAVRCSVRCGSAATAVPTSRCDPVVS